MKSLKKIFSAFDKINSFTIFCLTIVATVATVKSCGISRDIQKDERQLNKLDALVTNQQTQLNEQSSELSEIKAQTGIISKEYDELKNVDLGIDEQNKKISNQLAISLRQQKEQIKNAFLERKANIVRLRIMNRQLFGILITNDYMRYNENDFLQQVDLVEKVGSLLEREMHNPVLLEDDSILYQWVSLYSDLDNTRKAFNTQREHFSFSRNVNGKSISSNTEADLSEYRQNDYKAFAKSLNKFSYLFELFMQKRNKEIKINFD